MNYRIMKIGDKYTAQLIASNGPGDYVQRDGLECWSTPKFVMIKCLCDTIEEAKAAAEIYGTPITELALAVEVQS